MHSWFDVLQRTLLKCPFLIIWGNVSFFFFFFQSFHSFLYIISNSTDRLSGPQNCTLIASMLHRL